MREIVLALGGRNRGSESATALEAAQTVPNQPLERDGQVEPPQSTFREF